MNEFYCPLVSLILSPDINIENYELVISKGVKIVSNEVVPNLSIISEELSKTKLNYIKKDVNYWLCLDYNSSEEIQKIVNIFQLASWIVKPTELQIWFISNLAKDESKVSFLELDEKLKFTKINIKWCFDNKDIIKLKRIFPVLLKLYKNRPIFYTAIGLNFQGCVTFHWEAAYILYVTTFESLLTHKTHICKILRKKMKWGITKKLSWAYAILIGKDNKERQEEYNKFRNLYKIRSDIVHGKSFKDKYGNGDINLEELAKCRDMLRKLWQVILDSPEIIEKLSGKDGVRRKYFKKVANGWMPANLNEKRRCTILYTIFSFLKKLIGCNYS